MPDVSFADACEHFFILPSCAGRRAYARGRRGIRVMELLQRAGEKPAAGCSEALSFWVANLLPMETADRLRLLGLTHTRDRLAYELSLFDDHAAAGETCAVM